MLTGIEVTIDSCTMLGQFRAACRGEGTNAVAEHAVPVGGNRNAE